MLRSTVPSRLALLLLGFAATTAAVHVLSRAFSNTPGAAAWIYLPLVLSVTLRLGRRWSLLVVVVSMLLLATFTAKPYFSPLVDERGTLVRLLISGAGLTVAVLIIDRINRDRLRLERERATAEGETRLREERDRRAVAEAGEAYTRALLEAVPDPLLIVDADGRIVQANTQVEVCFGHPRDALVDQLVELLLPEAVREAHLRYRREYVAAPRTRPMGAGLQLSGRHMTGHAVPVEVSLAPVTVDTRRLVVCAIRDVTERRRDEAERERLLVSERQARDAAEAALAVRDHFLSTITHDLSQPLTTIQIAAQLLQREMAAPNEELDEIEAAATSAMSMVGELVDLAQLQVGRELDLHRSPTDLVTLVRREVEAQ
jgi:PAS domain S-box-containing protein